MVTTKYNCKGKKLNLKNLKKKSGIFDVITLPKCLIFRVCFLGRGVCRCFWIFVRSQKPPDLLGKIHKKLLNFFIISRCCSRIRHGCSKWGLGQIRGTYHGRSVHRTRNNVLLSRHHRIVDAVLCLLHNILLRLSNDVDHIKVKSIIFNRVRIW